MPPATTTLLQPASVLAAKNYFGSWLSQGNSLLTPENWELLVRNHIPYIRVRHFLLPHECQKIVSNLAQHGSFAEYLSPPVGKMGLSQFEYQNDKELYFNAVAEAEQYRRGIFTDVIDPLEKLLHWVRGHVDSGADIAQENGRRFFAGVFRETKHGVLLHVDYAPHDANGWSLDSVDFQLSWNIYLQTPDVGGSCLLYDQFWEPTDLAYQTPDSYGYDSAVLKTGRYEEIIPTVGDLVIFNSRNFHEVMPSNENRITMSSFIGQTSDGDTVFWS